MLLASSQWRNQDFESAGAQRRKWRAKRGEILFSHAPILRPIERCSGHDREFLNLRSYQQVHLVL